MKPNSLLSTFLTAMAPGLLFAVTVPMDLGRYESTMDRFGFFGFLFLPSILVFHLWTLIAALTLIPEGIARARYFRAETAHWNFSISGKCGFVGFCGYFLAIAGIGLFSHGGQFGIGPAGLLVLLVQFPSMILLLLAFVFTAIGYIALFFSADKSED